MFNIEIAQLLVSIDNKYSFAEKKCRDYITEKDNHTGIILSATEEQMQNSITYKLRFDGETMALPEAEFDVLPFPLYRILHEFNALWLHSVLIEKNGQGYAFTAAPGTGKTTHAKLWLQAFDDAVIVNGDNTIIRQSKDDDIFYGYGTPFCGKEGFNKNCRVPIKAICFLERSETNYVEKMNSLDAVLRMVKENFCLKRSGLSVAMKIYLSLAQQVQFYIIHCNMDPEAARTAYDGLQ